MARMSVPVLALGTAVALATAGAAVFLLRPSPDPITVRGTMSVPWDYGTEGQLCIAGSGYADIRSAQVVLQEDGGRTLATTQLQESGTLHLRSGGVLSGSDCVYPFVLQAPGGHEFYSVEVANRGALRYTADQLRKGLSLTLR